MTPSFIIISKVGGIMIKVSDTKMKEVINIENGERLGYIHDFEVDLDKGRITGIVMSSNPKGLNFFSKQNDIIIDWDEIEMIGTDIILVNFKA